MWELKVTPKQQEGKLKDLTTILKYKIMKYYYLTVCVIVIAFISFGAVIKHYELKEKELEIEKSKITLDSLKTIKRNELH